MTRRKLGGATMRGLAPVGWALAALSCSRYAGAVRPGGLVDVPPRSVCVTSGVVSREGARVHVADSAMRGVVAGDRSSDAELYFRYIGRPPRTAPLASGEMREQVGLKLRAKDTCNVVYVMWHLAPEPGVAVSVKHNPGKSTHEQCGATGYIIVKPRASQPAGRVDASTTHTLRATLEHRTLRVLADGVVTWEGELPAEAFSFDGPVGVRTDNVEADLTLRVPQHEASWASCLFAR
jgi:hypothetical protein